MAQDKGRVLGIGGIFFKSPDQARLRGWYAEHLGIKEASQGVTFPWRSAADPPQEHVTVWSVFPGDTTYFDPGKASFMVNYIVDDMDAMLAKLQESGARIDPKREDHDYGRFAWVYDADGNKIELWEPPREK